jgi:predicted NUDIX family phosphoesterase
MAEIEKVLVVKRSIYEELGTFHGVNFEVERYMERLIRGKEPKYIDRPEAEKNTQYKQLIPYVIIAHEDKYLCYQRGKRAGEQRLVNKVSIGIGGHINPCDDPDQGKMPLFFKSYSEIYENAVEREVTEEIAIESEYKKTIVGLLNDDSNEVGQVHLGIIHLWRLAEPKVKKREQMICQLSFMTETEMLKIKDNMETWSQLCLENLGELTRRSRMG